MRQSSHSQPVRLPRLATPFGPSRATPSRQPAPKSGRGPLQDKSNGEEPASAPMSLLSLLATTSVPEPAAYEEALQPTSLLGTSAPWTPASLRQGWRPERVPVAKTKGVTPRTGGPSVRRWK